MSIALPLEFCAHCLGHCYGASVLSDGSSKWQLYWKLLSTVNFFSCVELEGVDSFACIVLS